jgi:hypothetical protein
MKRIFIFSIILSVLLAGVAHRPANEINKKISSGDTSRSVSVLVVTFSPKLYMSQIDKQLALRNNLSFEQLVDRMRFDLAESVAFRVGDKMPSYSLFQPRNDSLMRELHFTYTSVLHSYRPLAGNDAIQSDPSKTTDKPIIRPLRNKIINPQPAENKKEVPAEPGTRIENGQVVSVEDPREKFMDCDIQNPSLLNELNTLYNSEYFIFLNQLDLLYSPESTEWIRIKVHYSCFNLAGKKIHAGAAIKNMPSSITDLSTIRNDYFYPIAIEIADKLNFAIKALLIPEKK